LKKFVYILGILFAIGNSKLFAQGCAVCTRTAENLDERSARGLNGGIVYLAFLPLAIMGTLGFIWWRTNKQP
jgi:hypothetical protein